MTDGAFEAKTRIEQALEVLRPGLMQYVVRRMKDTPPLNWRVYPELGGRRSLDTHGLLKAMLDNWQVFASDTPLRKARGHIGVCLEARNRVAHFAGSIDHREAIRYLDAILEVLGALGADESDRQRVMGLWEEQVVSPHRAAEKAENAKTIPPNKPAVRSKPAALGPIRQADRIRQFVAERHIAGARNKGLAEVTIRAGDIHKEMSLTGAMPAICSALGSRKFEELAGIRLVDRRGPTNGANVFFRYDIGGQGTFAASPAIVPRQRTASHHGDSLNLGRALVLVSCVKSKRPRAAPARDLYVSNWFQGVRELVETSGASWFILSSLYGLIRPEQFIQPYEYTLNSLGRSARRKWAKGVLDRLAPELAGHRRVVMFAGERYREFLIEPLQQRGLEVEIPMEGLRQGEQLEWLARHG